MHFHAQEESEHEQQRSEEEMLNRSVVQRLVERWPRCITTRRRRKRESSSRTRGRRSHCLREAGRRGASPRA